MPEFRKCVSVIRDPASFGWAVPNWIPALRPGNTILFRGCQYLRQFILVDISPRAISEEPFVDFIEDEIDWYVDQRREGIADFRRLADDFDGWMELLYHALQAAFGCISIAAFRPGDGDHVQ